MFRRIAFSVFASLCFSCASAADGDLDPHFGMQGIALSGAPNPLPSSPSKPARQTDGRIVICESLYDGVHEDFLVTRFAADGSVDDTFGNHGAVIVDFDGGNDECGDVGIESDGGIVLAGNSAPDPKANRIHFALAKLTSDGSLDTSFGAGTGKVVFSFAQNGNEFAIALAMHPYADGRIVVAGVLKLPSSNYDFAVARLAADGTFDSTFGNGGKVTVAFDLPESASKNDHLSALAVDSSDRLLLAGDVSATADNADDFGVARLLPDGHLDGTFGIGGRAVIAFDTGFS